MTKKKYIDIALPKAFVEKYIDPHIENGLYTTRPEMVKDAVRNKKYE